jgi:hypothetical protein
MEKTTVGCVFYGTFPSDRIPKATKGPVYITLFTVAIAVNSTSKFQEGFEPTAYNFIECLHVNILLCLIFMQVSIWR